MERTLSYGQLGSALRCSRLLARYYSSGFLRRRKDFIKSPRHFAQTF